MGYLGPWLVVHNETIVSMIVGHAGNVSIVKMGTVLEIVKHAHVSVPVFLSRLPELGIEDEILDLDSVDQSNIIRGTDFVLVLALAKMLDEANALFFPPFPNPLVGCNELTKRLLRFKSLFVNQFVILGNGGSRLGCLRIKDAGSGKEQKSNTKVHLDLKV